jgi:transcriptional regulator with XRE-family HTH domain
MNLIGPNIREIRRNMDLSQKPVVAKCNLLGWDISRATLAKIGSKKEKLAIEKLYLLPQHFEWRWDSYLITFPSRLFDRLNTN